MIIHIFTKESIVSANFMQFIYKNFEIEDHYFVFRKGALQYEYEEDIKNHILMVTNRYFFIYKLSPMLRKAKLIIFHSFPVGPSLFFWFLFPGLLDKVVWRIWGSDIHFFQYHWGGARSKIFEWIRKRLIKRIKVVAGPVDGDFSILKDIYGSEANFLFGRYPSPVDKKYLDKIKSTYKKTLGKKVLLGNSATMENEHLTMLEKLKKFKDSGLVVICPLSYGKPEYRRKVIEKGKRDFGENFIPLLELLDIKDYVKILAGIDVAIMNQKRQQGGMNIQILLYLGKKLYINKMNTYYDYLKSIGVKVFDTDSIEENNVEYFFSLDQERSEKNSSIIGEEFFSEKTFDQWKRLLSVDILK